MSNIATYIDQLIEALTRLPGVGRKGAERIAYFIGGYMGGAFFLHAGRTLYSRETYL